MNKAQIYKLIAERSEYSRQTVKEVCEIFLEAIAEDLAHGNKVKLAGFGSFHVKTWGGYVSRNAGENVSVKHVCKFTPGRGMKAAAEEGGEKEAAKVTDGRARKKMPDHWRDMR